MPTEIKIKRHKGIDWHCIGPHRLACGDCLEILPQIPSGIVKSIIADPPYGIAFQSNMRIVTPQMEKILNDEAPFVDWLPLCPRVMNSASALYCFYRWDVQDAFVAALRASGLEIKSQLVWWKPGGGLGDLKAQYAPEHELVLFAVQGDFAFPNGRPMSVVRVEKVPPNDMVHPNQKPDGLICKYIRWSTKENDVVLDPFMGSGTTGIACVKTGRRFIGIELDEERFDLSMKRISDAHQKHKHSFGLI